jgi:CheY-like chemotaxis protein
MHILLVEDDPGTAELMQEALASTGGEKRIDVVEDGESAVTWLRERSDQRPETLPDLLLLDLNLPGRTGAEVLAEVKAHPTMRRIPVVILTSSDADKDVTTCYDLKANCYLVKPSGLEGARRLARAIEAFWSGVARLPRG